MSNVNKYVHTPMLNINIAIRNITVNAGVYMLFVFVPVWCIMSVSVKMKLQVKRGCVCNMLLPYNSIVSKLVMMANYTLYGSPGPEEGAHQHNSNMRVHVRICNSVCVRV